MRSADERIHSGYYPQIEVAVIAMSGVLKSNRDVAYAAAQNLIVVRVVK